MNLALTALLVFCLIAWGFVLVPPAVRLLSGVVRPSDSITSFRSKMAVLAGSTPSSYLGAPSATPPGVPAAGAPAPLRATAPAPAPRQVHDLAERRRAHAVRADGARRRAARARRRQIFTGLLASVPVTLLLGLAAGGVAWMLFTLSVLAFGAYTALLWQMQQRTLERRRKVAVLPTVVHPMASRDELRPVSVVGR